MSVLSFVSSLCGKSVSLTQYSATSRSFTGSPSMNRANISLGAMSIFWSPRYSLATLSSLYESSLYSRLTSLNRSKMNRPGVGTVLSSLSPRALEDNFLRKRLHVYSLILLCLKNSRGQLVTPARTIRYSRSNPKMFQPVMMSTSCSWRYAVYAMSMSRSVSKLLMVVSARSGSVCLKHRQVLSYGSSVPKRTREMAIWKQASPGTTGSGNFPVEL